MKICPYYVLENFVRNVLILELRPYFILYWATIFFFASVQSVDWWKEQPSWKEIFAARKSKLRSQLSGDTQSNFNEHGIDGK